MSQEEIVSGTKRAVFRASAVLNNIGVTVALLYILLTVANVFSRFVFNYPIAGTNDFVCWGLMVVGMFALARTQAEKANITIDFASGLLPPKVLAYADVILHSIATVVYGVLVWRMVVFALRMKATGAYSTELRLPEWIVPLIGAIGMALFTVVLAVDVTQFVAELRGKK